MKQILQIKASALLIGALCGLASCEKESLTGMRDSSKPDTEAINKATYAEQVAYTHKHLFNLGQAIALLQNNEQIRNLIYDEFDASTPGLENVLFSTLIKKAADKGIDLEGEMNRALAAAGTNESATNSILAFKNIGGNTWQPQIYIPNYAALKKSNRISNRLNNASPAFFTYAGESGKTDYQTFQIDHSGKVEKAFIATEESSASNEVMIISLSERLNNNTKNATASRPTGSPVEAEIGMMGLKTGREDWAGGASEVAATGAVVWNAPNGLNPFNPPNNIKDISRVGPGGLADYDGTGGYQVADWTRKEVSNSSWKTVNFKVVINWNPYWYPIPGDHGPVDALGDTGAYIIYEADAWPSAMRGEEWTIAGQYVRVDYRSSDNPFHSEMITTDPSKPSNNTGNYSSSGFSSNYFNYMGHYPITSEIQYWFR